MLKSFYALSLFMKVKYSDSYENEIPDFKSYTQNIEITDENNWLVSTYNLEQTIVNEEFTEKSSKQVMASKERSQFVDGPCFHKGKIIVSSLRVLFKKLFGIRVEYLSENESLELSNLILQSVDET